MADAPVNLETGKDADAHAAEVVASAAVADAPGPLRKKKKLSDEVVLVTIGQVAQQGGIIVLTMILARLLSVVEYGTFRQLWMINRTTLEISTFGIPMSVAYFLPRLATRAHRGLIGRAFWMMVALGLVTGWALVAAAGPIAEYFNNPALGPLLRVFALYTVLLLPTQPLRGIMVNYSRASGFAIFNIVDQTALLGTAVLVLVLGGGLTELVWTLVGLGSVRLLAYFVFVAWVLRLEQVGLAQVASPTEPADEVVSDRVGVVGIFMYGLPLGLSWAIDAANVMFDKFITATFFSVQEFARYANGAFHVPLVGMVVGSTNSVLLPEYVRMFQAGDTAGVLHLWHRSVRATAMLFFPVTAFLVVFAEPFVVMMFSATYADSAVVLQVYVLAMLPKLTYYSYVLIAMGRTRDQLVASVLSLSINAVTSLTLVRVIGVLGPAIGTVLAEFACALYFLVQIKRVTRTPFARVFPWRSLGVIMMVSVAAALICGPVLWLPIGGGLWTVLIGLVMFGLVVLSLLYLAGQVTRQDLRRLAGRLPIGWGSQG